MAVKVQRPGVKESIALDIYILRSLAVVIRRVRKINSDLGEILDEASPTLQPLKSTCRKSRNITIKACTPVAPDLEICWHSCVANSWAGCWLSNALQDNLLPGDEALVLFLVS